MEEANKKDYEDKKFLAALQGVDLDENSGNSGTKTFEDIRREALGDDPRTNDVANLKGSLARQEGFGIGHGLMYDEWDARA